MSDDSWLTELKIDSSKNLYKCCVKPCFNKCLDRRSILFTHEYFNTGETCPDKSHWTVCVYILRLGWAVGLETANVLDMYNTQELWRPMFSMYYADLFTAVTVTLCFYSKWPENVTEWHAMIEQWFPIDVCYFWAVARYGIIFWKFRSWKDAKALQDQ